MLNPDLWTPAFAGVSGKKVSGIFVFFFAFFVSIIAFAHDGAQPKLPTMPLKIETASGDLYSFMVEMALSPSQREHGLMFRDELKENEGMIFFSGKDEAMAIWMKNTPHPLDILFIRSDGTIASFVERAEPLSLKPMSSQEPVRAALELRAGTVRRLGLKKGDRIDNILFGYKQPHSQ